MRSLIRAFFNRLYIMTVTPLTKLYLEFLSFKGGFAGSSESTDVKMPHFWKSHVAAQICICMCTHIQSKNTITEILLK